VDQVTADPPPGDSAPDRERESTAEEVRQPAAGEVREPAAAEPPGPTAGAVPEPPAGAVPEPAAGQRPVGAPAEPGVPVGASDGLPAARRRTGVRRLLPLIGSISLIAVCAIAILGLVGWNIGLDGLVIGLVAAILPVPVIVLAFLWLGRYDPEPVPYLVFCFTWGAFVATLAALGVNTGAQWAFDRWGLPFTLVPVLVAPVIEELMKFAAPLLLWLVRRHSISGVTKGIIYCGLSATGFAMVENILYLGGVGYRAGMDEYGPATGLMALFTIFIARILMSGFAHPLFPATAGVGLGIAARSTSRAVRWLSLVTGVLVAMMLHGTWNFMSVLVAETGEILFFLYGYVALMVPLLLAMVGLAIWLRSREGQLTQRTLPDYVRAGWLTPPEVASLRTLSTRYSARRWARRVAGEPGVRAMRGFQLAATRLAVLRDHVRRTPDMTPAEARRAEAEQAALLQEISRHRAVYVGRDPQVPVARWDGQGYLVVFPDGQWRPVPPPAEPAVPVPVVLQPPPEPPRPHLHW